MKSPDDIFWIEGDLPPVESVSITSRLLVWLVVDITQEEYERCESMCKGMVPSPELNGKFCGITNAYPNQDSLNPLRWFVGYGPYIPGHKANHQKVAYYAWIHV